MAFFKDRYKIIAADFETINVESNNEIYAWGYIFNGVFKYGIDPIEFVHAMVELKGDIHCYFHNGGRFDYYFLISVLDRMGYEQQAFMYEEGIITQKIISPHKEANKDEKLQPLNYGEYRLIVNADKTIICLDVATKDVKLEKDGERARYIKFLDSRQIFIGSIDSYGKQLNIHHKTEKYTKMKLKCGHTKKIQYKAIDEFESDGNKLDYLHQDCTILYDYLHMIDESFSRTKWGITAAATAQGEFKRMFGSKLLKEAINAGRWGEKATKNSTAKNPFHKYIKNNSILTKPMWQGKAHRALINEMLPTKWLNKINHDGFEIEGVFLAQWYSGGQSHLDPLKRGIPVTVGSIDINSSHSSVMMDCNMPVGIPFHGEHKDYPFQFMTIEATEDMINDTGLKILHIYIGDTTVYPKKIYKGERFKVTTPIWEQVQIYYGHNWSVEVERSFKTVKGAYIFGDFIGKWHKIKQEAKASGNKGLEAIAKLMLVSIYGKFATKALRENSIWVPKIGSFESELTLIESKFYLPIGIAITAYVRAKLIKVVGHNYKKAFVYCDTDCIYYLWKNRHLILGKVEIDDNKLGAWKVEIEKGTGVFRRKKQYMVKYQKDGKEQVKTVMSGYTFYPDKKKYNIPSSFDFLNGCTVSHQTENFRTSTGVVIEDRKMEIKPLWIDNNTVTEEEEWFRTKKEYMTRIKKQTKLINGL